MWELTIQSPRDRILPPVAEAAGKCLSRSRFRSCVVPAGCSSSGAGSVRERRSVRAFPRPSLLLASATLLVACLAPATSAWADHPASGPVEALQKKYLLTQLTPDNQQVTKDGTTMVMKCAGVYTVPGNSIMEPDNTVQNGSLKGLSGFAKMTFLKMGTHVLQTGEKVYITKIESKGGSGDELRFTILSADPMDSQSGQQRFKGVVSFKFSKGYLDETPPEQIEEAVETIMAPDAGDDSQGNGNGGQNQGPPPPAAPPPPPRPAPAVAPAPPPPPPAPAGPPPTVSIGESSTQVLQALGMPLQMVDLGKKKTYIYKNMKIIFVDDKVSDVQ